MKKLLVLSISIVFLSLFTLSASAQDNKTTPPPAKTEEPKKEEVSPIVSKWDISINAMGQEMIGTLKLEKDGDVYKGSVFTDLGEAPLKNIKIKDNTFTADITVNVQGQMMEGTVGGKTEEGKISGDINLPGLGAIQYSGKKPKDK